MPVDGSTLALLLLTGFAAGVLSALMGIGGGLLMVPALHYGWGLDWHEATALSLVAILVQAPMGIWRHHRKGAVDVRHARPLVAGGLVGVLVGGFTQHMVPVAALRLLFALVLLWAGWRLIAHVAPARRPARLTLVLAVGMVAGVAAKWLGIGGGMVMVPLLVMGGVSAHIAVGTSLIPVWTNAAVATAVNAFGPHLHVASVVLQGLPLGAGALGGAWAGVHVAHALPEAGLRKVLGILLAAAALWMAASTLLGVAS